jgi:hypothetical protein
MENAIFRRSAARCSDRSGSDLLGLNRSQNGEVLTMANMMLMAFEFLFGCWHRNLSRPFTLSGWTYEVCLNCGKKLEYDRVELGCVVARRKNSAHAREYFHQDRASISLVSQARQEGVKLA